MMPPVEPQPANEPVQDVAPAAEAAPLRRFTTAELFGPERVVLIDHHGKLYRLSITRHNRLILQA